MIPGKNSFRAIVKFALLIALGAFVFMSCENKKVADDKNANISCFNVRELICEVADIPFEDLNFEIERSKDFNIITDINDVGSYELNNGILLKEVLEDIAKSSSIQLLKLNYCANDSIGFKGNIKLLLSDAHMHNDYTLTYGRLNLNDKEYIEFNFLYFKGEIIFKDCATIFVI